MTPKQAILFGLVMYAMSIAFIGALAMTRQVDANGNFVQRAAR